MAFPFQVVDHLVERGGDGFGLARFQALAEQPVDLPCGRPATCSRAGPVHPGTPQIRYA
jgi:hypothetical protein